MGPNEIAYRAVELAKKSTWRRDLRGWSNFHKITDGPISDLALLRDCLAQAASSDAKSTTTESVRRAVAGEFEFFGQRWPVTDRDDWRTGQPSDAFWRRDPVSGNHWPGTDTFCFDVDFRNANNDLGDVKYVWELNRLQFLHPIAAEIALKGDAALTRWAFRVISSWAYANPPFRGVNWASGIELALRIVSLAIVVAAANPDGLGRDERQLVRRLIAAHGYWLDRFPSRFSSANNHLVAEALGLFVAGTLVPDLDDAESWVRRGRAVLETEALKQILEDGVGVEQSPTYQAFTMELLAFAVLLAKCTRKPLSSVVTDRLCLGATHLIWMLDCHGRAPAIGDNDEGRVIAQPPDHEPRYVASVVRVIAGLASRLDLGLPEHDPHLRDTLFSAPLGVRALPRGMRVFPTGGYTVVRDQIQNRQLHLAFDHGPLGYLSIAAHGHADALSVWLTLDDVPIFVDAGTYLYHAGRTMREHLRGTEAHNTLILAGQSQSRTSGPFMWARKATAHLVEFSPWPAWSVAGEHDGYKRSFGVRHCRTLERAQNGIMISDRLDQADRSFPVTLQFLCHPDLTASLEDDGILISLKADYLLKIVPPAHFQMHITKGEHAIGRGWYSSRFGMVIPAPLVVLSGELSFRNVTTSLDILPPATTSNEH